MKLIIDIPDELYNDIVKYLTDNDGNYAYSDFNLREIIRNGKPYDEAEVWKKSNELLEKRLAYLGKPIIKCQDCKYRVKEWREDERMKEKGYWVYGCEHFGEIMGYWGFGGNDNEFCSDAEPKGGTE